MGGFFLGEGGMYKREDIIIVPIQTFPLSILAFSPLPPWHQVTSRDNHWWRHSLAYVVEDGVWYTLRVENFYYRNVGGNASPPNKKCLSSEGVLQLPSPPPFFGAYVSRTKMLENQSSHFWRKVKTMISLGNNSPILHFWRKLLLAILLLSRINRKCLNYWVIIIIFLI